MALVMGGKRKLKKRLLQWQQRNSLEIETIHTNVAETIKKGELGQEPMPHSLVPWHCWENQTIPTKS